MVTACSTCVKELLYPSPVLLVLLLHLLLRQLEVLKNKANLEEEWRNLFSTRSTTSPSEGKMERNH